MASNWTVEQVVAWLVECGLEDLDETFTSHKVDGARLLALTEEEMTNELKIRSSLNRQVLIEKRDALLRSPLSWGVEQVVAWLVECGLEDLDDKFTSHKVDGARLLALTEEEMVNELKIRSSMNRQVLIEKRQQLLEGDKPQAAVAVKDMLPVEFCASHNKPLEVYCETDEVLICFDCLLATHNGHKFMPVREVPTTKGTQLKIYVVQVSQDAQESKKRLEEVEEEMKVLDGTLGTALEEVERRFAALHEVVEGRKTKVLEEVKLKHGEARETLEVRAARDQERLKLAGEIVSPLDKILRAVESNPLAALTMGTKEVTNAAISLLDSKPGAPDKSKPELEVAFSQTSLKLFQESLLKLGKIRVIGEGFFKAPVYTFDTLFGNQNVSYSEEGLLATRITSSSHVPVMVLPRNSQADVLSFIKFKIVQDSGWIMLGIVANAQPANFSYSDPTCFGFADGSQVYIRGASQYQYGGWATYSSGDVCILKLDLIGKKLSMHNSRLQKVFTIDNIAEADYFFHVNLHYVNDKVQILPVEPEDILQFEE